METKSIGRRKGRRCRLVTTLDVCLPLTNICHLPLNTQRSHQLARFRRATPVHLPPQHTGRPVIHEKNALSCRNYQQKAYHNMCRPQCHDGSHFR
ncbi:hypothetical protein E2C01_092033 [Portunus trituberculatus]|uniref:Uncharacterized protein n=1 Tax=Portunus trituberculatus TaxID=210409 RepID=A0A5B7JUE9_PORTR|nr:hypothetical protein [Portunus trituberculatus]